LGATSGNVTVPLTGVSDTFLFSKTYTASSAYGTNEFGIRRVVTGGTNALSGAVLTVENRSTGTTDNSTVLYLNQNNGSAATGAFLIQAQATASVNLLTLDNAGNFNIKNGYQINGTAGASTTCTAGQSLIAQTVVGGIVTGGTCGTGAGQTLQNVYDGSSTPATITTSSATKGILFKAGATFDNATLFQVQNAAAVSIFTTDTLNKIVQVGSATPDGVQVNLALDQYNVFTDSGTCNSAATPSGSMYYNTATNAIRACVGSSFTDLASTADLGILLYGVVADSGTNPGDLASLANPAVSGPCKVSWASATSVSVAACTAYSAGRKIVVPITSIAINTLTTTNIWAHICLNATGAPTLSTGAPAETANLLTVSLPLVNAPLVCLADIKGSAVTANNISQIYDVRTFTNTQKEYVTISATAAGLGQVVIASGSNASQSTTAASTTVMGIVIATTGTTSTTTPNAIIAVAGPTYAKASAGTAGNFVQNSTTVAGYTQTTAADAFGAMGINREAWTGTCTAAATCIDSVYFNQAIR